MSEAFPLCLRDIDRIKSAEPSGSWIRHVEVRMEVKGLPRPSALTVSRCIQKVRALPYLSDTKKELFGAEFIKSYFSLSFPIRNLQVY